MESRQSLSASSPCRTNCNCDHPEPGQCVARAFRLRALFGLTGKAGILAYAANVARAFRLRALVGQRLPRLCRIARAEVARAFRLRALVGLNKAVKNWKFNEELPEPFGIEPFSDFNPGCAYCIYLCWVTRAFRHRALFGRNPRRPQSTTSWWSRQSLSASSPFRTHCIRNGSFRSSGGRQSLSASSPCRTHRQHREAYAFPVRTVVKAFRLRALVGLMLIGEIFLIIKNCHQSLSASSPFRTSPTLSHGKSRR